MQRYRIKTDGKQLCREKKSYGGFAEAVEKEFGESSAWILFWEQYRVDFAWYDGKEISWPEGQEAKEEYLLEARVFNPEKELHITSVSGTRGEGNSLSLTGRVLAEEEDMQGQPETGEAGEGSADGEIVFRKKEMPYMWGSKVENGCISEERGMRYHLPNTYPSDYIAFGYEIVQYYLPDAEDGMLRLMDYRLSRIYQDAAGKRRFLEGGRMEHDGK